MPSFVVGLASVRWRDTPIHLGITSPQSGFPIASLQASTVATSTSRLPHTMEADRGGGRLAQRKPAAFAGNPITKLMRFHEGSATCSAHPTANGRISTANVIPVGAGRRGFARRPTREALIFSLAVVSPRPRGALGGHLLYVDEGRCLSSHHSRRTCCISASRRCSTRH
jgi:hypothetical protein